MQRGKHGGFMACSQVAPGPAFRQEEQRQHGDPFTTSSQLQRAAVTAARRPQLACRALSTTSTCFTSPALPSRRASTRVKGTARQTSMTSRNGFIKMVVHHAMPPHQARAFPTGRHNTNANSQTYSQAQMATRNGAGQHICGSKLFNGKMHMFLTAYSPARTRSVS